MAPLYLITSLTLQLSIFLGSLSINHDEREGKYSSQATEFLAYELELHCRCGSDFGFSEDGLRETIERHGFTPSNNSPNISDYDFFLWACYNERVTVGIVRYLLEYFPAAANAADGDGRTPLHMKSSLMSS